jgi:hypothetical protein
MRSIGIPFMEKLLPVYIVTRTKIGDLGCLLTKHHYDQLYHGYILHTSIMDGGCQGDKIIIDFKHQTWWKCFKVEDEEVSFMRLYNQSCSDKY